LSYTWNCTGHKADLAITTERPSGEAGLVAVETQKVSGSDSRVLSSAEDNVWLVIETQCPWALDLR
jgi:hypothetical protein